VVIGISTDGAAPVLGQAIRRRIETLLPPALSGWAMLAKSLRANLKAKVPSPTQRRAFWERFAERAFTSAPPESADAFGFDAAPVAGHVTLVGAGPGDAELLTLKAVRALQAADVILFDDLVSDDVLDLARREAKRMLVGKRGGRASCRQEEINDLMVKLARQGKRVVRLKSGDPMIFGRAGEEIAELRAAGISVEVVPGITAALAMASALGVSLTHRAHAQSLRLITGHGRNGDLPPGLDWRGLADPASTLVFYMAGRTAPEIVRRLIAQGLEAATPVVVVESLSRPEERRRAGRLDALPALCADGFEGPVLIGVGQVFASPAEAVAAAPLLSAA
jgi:uroporphyrin-III C-methyltransferase/precorrin-2 dehydrogenase/sirohydrochlorin ferrochelatase